MCDPAFLLSLTETYRDAEHRDGQRNRDVEGKTGPGQNTGGAPKVSSTQTQREAINEEKISKLETDYHCNHSVSSFQLSGIFIRMYGFFPSL